MNFSDQPPSKQWAVLKYRGEPFAEVWFKPEGEPFGLTFRIPRGSFQLPGLAPRLTLDNLLRAVGIGPEEVESCRREGAPDLEPGHLLPPPAQDLPHLDLSIRLKPPAPADAPPKEGEAEIPEDKWQALETRWKAILGLEASMETVRLGLESLLGEMESSSRRTLTTDEKVNALNADVAQWNKAKSRIVYALPKVREFIHRSTWVTATPERKELEDLYKSRIQPRIPFPQIDKVAEQLENLLKDRQVLSAQGVSVFQECKGITADVQGALRTLQGNAAANATRKRGQGRARGKSF